MVVDGRLDAEGLDDLERVVADLPGLVRVELAGLRSADEMALDALRALRARGVALTGVSQYFRILLGAAERRQAREPPSPLERTRNEKRGRGAQGSRRKR